MFFNLRLVGLWMVVGLRCDDVNLERSLVVYFMKNRRVEEIFVWFFRLYLMSCKFYGKVLYLRGR